MAISVDCTTSSTTSLIFEASGISSDNVSRRLYVRLDDGTSDTGPSTTGTPWVRISGLTPGTRYEYAWEVDFYTAGNWHNGASGTGTAWTDEDSGGGTDPDPDPPASGDYTWDCYDLTIEDYIKGYETSTSSSEITAPNISGYTYKGYVYYDTWKKCTDEGKKGNFDGTERTCSRHSASNPIIVFFYEEAPEEYYWGCYDLTNKTDIKSLTSTTSTSVSAPSLSGYSYQGYVYHSTYDKCITYGTQGNYDGTEDTCSKLSSTYPYVIFFYTKDQPKYYWKSYDLTNSTDISSSKTTTNPSISAPSYSNYSYTGFVYHSSYNSCISQGSRRSFDGTASTATASTTYPYVVFFYDRIYYTYITYHYNGGSGSYNDGQQVSYSSTTSNRTITLDTPTKANYTFLGWGSNSSSADLGTTYSVSSTNNISKDVYAIWRRNTITVTYNANGGSGGPGSQTVNTNSSFNINGSNFPTKSNYIFKGWSTSSSAKTATYKKGATPSISAETSNITYYAIWWPAFTWKDYSRSEANTFAGYINTYLNSSITTINDTNPLRLVVWFNAIATALGNNTKVISGDASFKTQLDTLLTAYNNY